MVDVQEVCDRIVLIHKGRIVVHRSIGELVSKVEREIEIVVWGGTKKMDEELSSRGLETRRLGRVIRVKLEDDYTVKKILEAAVSADVQVRQLYEYEPDLEDVFLLIMEKLGSEIKGSSDLISRKNNGEEELNKYKKGDKIKVKVLEIKVSDQKL